MKNKRNVLLGAGAAVLILIGVLAFHGRGREGVQVAEGAQPGRKSMQGTDMGRMDMGSGTVRFSPGEFNTFGITFGAAEVRPLSKRIRAVGLIEFDETRMAYVAPKFGGWAERLHVDFTGQVVRKGQPLLEVYSPELVTAQEELLLAVGMAESVGGSSVESVARGADILLASARRRLRYLDISAAQIRQLLETGKVRRTLTLYAPASGVVMKKDVFDGQAFRSGQNLYMIADLSEVWVTAEVFEADAALLREGMPVELTIAALPGRTFRGQVEYVYPTLGETTRSMAVRITLANPSGEIKPGMYATVEFTATLGTVLTVPTSAVLHTGERAIAFVDMGGGQLMPHELTLGQTGEQYVHVLAGLEPGQRVVTSAQFLLDSESNLAEVMRAMMAQMNVSDMESMDMEGMDTGGMQMERMDGSDGKMMDMPDRKED